MSNPLFPVWTHGGEGYHLDRSLKENDEKEVLNALADEYIAAGVSKTYIDAMQRACHKVEDFRLAQSGVAVAKNAHNALKKRNSPGFKPA